MSEGAERVAAASRQDMLKNLSLSVPIPDLLRILQVGLREESRWTPALCNSPNDYNRNLPEWRHQICTWIVEVAQEFRFSIETVAVSMNYFDRLVSEHVIPHTQLQTHALACIYIASKQLESRPLCGRHLHIFSEICNATQLHTIEINSLHKLGWDMNVFTSFSFVQHLVQLISEVPTSGVGNLALEFCRHAIFDFSLANLPPSQIGISALACACQILDLDHQPLLVELASRNIIIVENREVSEKLFQLRRSFQEQQKQRYEETLNAEKALKSQEHELPAANIGEDVVDMEIAEPSIPITSSEHVQRTSTATQSVVSSHEFRTDDSREEEEEGGEDTDDLDMESSCDDKEVRTSIISVYSL